MADSLESVTKTGFLPCENCYFWPPDTLWLHVGSDSTIAFAYFAISVLLIALARRRKEIPFRRILFIFGAFVFAGGLTHFFSALIVWNPYYVLDVFIKSTTAAISLLTAILLAVLLPKVIAFKAPTTSKHEAKPSACEPAFEKSLPYTIVNNTEFTDPSGNNILAKLSTLTDSSPLPIVLVAPSGQIEEWNPATKDAFGWSDTERGQSIVNYTPSQHRKMFQLLLECAGKGETLHKIDIGWLHKNGASLAVLLTLAPIRDSQQKVVGIYAIYTDIATERATQKTLQQAKTGADKFEPEKRTIAHTEPGSDLDPLYPHLILVAEDFPPNQEVIELQLRSLGYEVHIANDGFEAIAMAKARRYDIILMDVRMPNMDGIEATRQIRRNEHPSLLQVPIIAVTAEVQPSERQRCFDAGMNDFISKPVRKEILVTTLQRWLRDQPLVIKPAQPPQQTSVVESGGLPEPVERLLRDLPPKSTLTVLQTALKQTSPQIEMLLEALRNRNWTTADTIAHRLKGTSKYYAEERFNQLLNRVGARNTDDFEASVDTLIEDLANEYMHIQQQLQRAIAELQTRLA